MTASMQPSGTLPKEHLLTRDATLGSAILPCPRLSWRITGMAFATVMARSIVMAQRHRHRPTEVGIPRDVETQAYGNEKSVKSPTAGFPSDGALRFHRSG